MASTIRPIITFKAGICDVNDSVTPIKVTPRPDPGYLYLYEEDEFLHFCWRKRSTPVDLPELDLFMVDGDGIFEPAFPPNAASPATNGRVFVLKFSSSSQRHFFWLQARAQQNSAGGVAANPAYYSQRDVQLGKLVNRLLQGDRQDVAAAVANLGHQGGNRGGDGDDNDDDETMEDVEGSRAQHAHPHSGSGGGAGADATGGDVRAEGGEAREGGGDGGRAATVPQENDASVLLQNLVRSIAPAAGVAPQEAQNAPDNDDDDPFTSLGDLLNPASTIPFIDHTDEQTVNNLLSYLPTSLIQTAADTSTTTNTTDENALLNALPLPAKKDILRRVLRSPQFTQSLHSLTIALQDGGLPMISEALRVRVADGGFIRNGAVPLANARAIRAFVEGVKRQVAEEDEEL